MLRDKDTFKNWVVFQPLIQFMEAVFSTGTTSLIYEPLLTLQNAMLQSFQYNGNLSKMLGLLATHIGQGCQHETTWR
jgi:hypothetical protein